MTVSGGSGSWKILHQLSSIQKARQAGGACRKVSSRLLEYRNSFVRNLPFARIPI